jgi:hypothetical protein
MKKLNLIIRQKYFDKIKSGRKTKEYREIRPNSQSKYCDLDEDGFCKEVNGVLQPRKYDAIKFYVGYNKNRDMMLIEVLDACIELFTDEKGNFVEYEYQGEKYLAAQVVYDLGKVLA